MGDSPSECLEKVRYLVNRISLRKALIQTPAVLHMVLAYKGCKKRGIGYAAQIANVSAKCIFKRAKGTICLFPLDSWGRLKADDEVLLEAPHSVVG